MHFDIKLFGYALNVVSLSILFFVLFSVFCFVLEIFYHRYSSGVCCVQLKYASASRDSIRPFHVNTDSIKKCFDFYLDFQPAAFLNFILLSTFVSFSVFSLLFSNENYFFLFYLMFLCTKFSLLFQFKKILIFSFFRF